MLQAIDFRNCTYADIQTRIHPTRLAVYLDLEKYGPCTTRVLAEKSGRDLLMVRPRVTELLQLGLIEVMPLEQLQGQQTMQHKANEGVYRALTYQEMLAHCDVLVVTEQLQLQKV